jgi:hypothetical protein
MDYYYTNKDNASVGPFSEEQIRQLYHQGTLHDNTLVLAGNATDWQPYASLWLSGKQPLFPPPSGPAAGSVNGLHHKSKFLAVAMLVAASAVLALPATRDELGWLRVSEDESVADEQAYLDAWPEGRHAGEARVRIQRHAWSMAFRLDSVVGFQEYLAAFPEGGHVAEAQARIEALKWEAAVTTKDVKPLEDFLRDHPDSEHAGEARAQIDALARQQALEASQRIRLVRSGLADIFVSEGAGGDGSGRNWDNACGSLNAALEGKLAPGARIHVAAGLIQDEISVPDNTHLICGYGRNARGTMELNPRLHRVWLMPAADGVRSMNIGKGCRVAGLWLGVPTSAPIERPVIVYKFCNSITGPANLKLSGTGTKMDFQDAVEAEDFDPLSRQVIYTLRATGLSSIESAAAHPLARLDRPPF